MAAKRTTRSTSAQSKPAARTGFAATTPSRFSGFPEGGAAFFRALAKNQNREWFQAHRDDYDRLWSKPMEALLSELAPKLARQYVDCGLRPPKVFRIHRDVRFAADKTPYKTTIAGVIAVAGAGAQLETPAAVYVQLGSDEMVGAGLYMMQGPALAKFRTALLDAKEGPAIAKIVERVAAAGFTVGSYETLKTAPRGVPADHPNVDLLRRKGLVVAFPVLPAGLTRERALLDWLVDKSRMAAPLVRWLARHVG